MVLVPIPFTAISTSTNWNRLIAGGGGGTPFQMSFVHANLVVALLTSHADSLHGAQRQFLLSDPRKPKSNPEEPD